MPLEVPVFIDLENRATRVLARAARKAIKEQTRGLREAVNQGDMGGAQRLVSEINLGPAAKEVQGELKLLALNGILLGAAQFVEGREARDTMFVRDRVIPPEVERAVEQVVAGFDGTQTEKVRQVAQQLLQEEEVEDPSAPVVGQGGFSLFPAAMAHIFKRVSARKHYFQKQALASRLTAAVNAGTTLQAGVSANLMTSRMVTFGALRQAQAGGIREYQWNAILDSRTCRFCQGMHGKTFKVAPALSEMTTILHSQDPNVAKALSPWPPQTIANINRLSELSDEKLQLEGLSKPPAHPFCRCVMSIVGTVQRGPGFLVRTPRAPAEPEPIAAKKPTTAKDFADAEVDVDVPEGAGAAKVLEDTGRIWDETIQAPPKQFFDDISKGLPKGAQVEGDVSALPRLGPAGSDTLELNGAIVAEDGTVLGQFRRNFFRDPDGTLRVEHDLFFLEKGEQGAGVAKRLMANMELEYERMGVAKVELLANLDVGGYAWARYGFVPTQDAWNIMRSRILRQIENLLNKGVRISDDTLSAINLALRTEDPRAIWQIADLTEDITVRFARPVEGTLKTITETRSIGKQLLLGQSWEGELALSDDLAMARFRAYVNRKAVARAPAVPKKPDLLQTRIDATTDFDLGARSVLADSNPVYRTTAKGSQPVDDLLEGIAGRRPDLSANDLQVIERYTSFNGSILNNELRDAAAGAELNVRTARFRDAVDRILKKSSLNDDLVVYRGATQSHLEDLRIGTEFADDAFNSWTTSRRIAGRFARRRGEDGVVFRVQLEAGQKALSVGGPEFEVLLQRGVKFRVTGIEEGVEIFQAGGSSRVSTLVTLEVI